jgi:phage terminase large subunit-like protein
VFKDRGDIRNLMLLSVFQEQIEYPDLRKMATRLANNYEDTDMENPLYGVDKPDLILIEAKVSGYSLHADLMRAGLPVMKFNPNKYGDKENRCRLVSHLMENGLVWLQTESPKHEYLTREAQLFLKDATIFPNGASMDIIDSMSQALIRLTEGGYLMNKEDPVPPQQEAWVNDTRKYW